MSSYPPTVNGLGVLRAALEGKSCQVVDVQEMPGQLRLTGRVQEERVVFANWLLAVHHVNECALKASWKADISKLYFNREGDRKLVYTWRLIFQAADVPSHYGAIAQAIRNAPKSDRVELTSFKLPGASANRNAGRADYVGKLIVGRDARR